MKILLCHKVDGAWGFITESFKNAFEDAGHTVVRYDNKISSWHKFDPDLYIGCSGHQQLIPNKSERKCKVAIHVNPYCEYKIEPSINENGKSIDWVKGKKPDVVFGYGFEEDRRHWVNWDLNGIKWVPMPTAGDATLFSPDFDNYEHRNVDYVYLGGRWAYKAQNIDKYLFHVINSPLNGEVWGWGDWPQNYCKGVLDDADVIGLYRRGIVAPCLSEPHTNVWGIDVPERMYKAILGGCIVVNDKSPTIKTVLPQIIQADTPIEYYNHIRRILSMSVQDRKEMAIGLYKAVIGAHTYHHRISNLIRSVGFNDESVKMLECIKKYEYSDNSSR